MEAIEEVMDEFKNSELVSELLEKIKEENKVDLEKWKDDKWHLFEEKIDTYFSFDKSALENYKIRSSYTSKDIVNFLERVDLDTVYYLEGEKDGK